MDVDYARLPCDIQQYIMRKAVRGMTIDQRLAAGLHPGRLAVPNRMFEKIWVVPRMLVCSPGLVEVTLFPAWFEIQEFMPVVSYMTAEMRDGRWERYFMDWDGDGIAVQRKML